VSNKKTEQDPQATQPNPTQCYANLHLTPEEYGYWNLFRMLSHKTGRLEFGGRHVIKYFDREEGRATGVNKPGAIRQSLVALGWLKCTREANTVRMLNGQYAPPQYEVLSHEQWAAEHPGACAKRLALNVEKPKPETPSIIFGKKNAARPYVQGDTITGDAARPSVQGTHVRAGRNHLEQVKPPALDQQTDSTLHDHGCKASPSVHISDKNHSPFFSDTGLHDYTSKDSAARMPVQGDDPYARPGMSVERAKDFIANMDFADDLFCTRCNGWGGFMDQTGTCQRSGDDNISCGGTGLTAAQWLDTIKEQWVAYRKVLQDLFEKFEAAVHTDKDSMVAFYNELCPSAKALILDRYPEHEGTLKGEEK
jgi:hypothetical protein